jgi:hypothetical protein
MLTPNRRLALSVESAHRPFYEEQLALSLDPGGEGRQRRGFSIRFSAMAVSFPSAVLRSLGICNV